MRTAKLRAVGGSVMLAIPRPILELANLKEGSSVGLHYRDGNIVVSAVEAKRIGLKARLAKCKARAPVSPDERAWLEMPSAGLEKVGRAKIS